MIKPHEIESVLVSAMQAALDHFNDGRAEARDEAIGQGISQERRDAKIASGESWQFFVNALSNVGKYPMNRHD